MYQKELSEKQKQFIAPLKKHLDSLSLNKKLFFVCYKCLEESKMEKYIDENLEDALYCVVCNEMRDVSNPYLNEFIHKNYGPMDFSEFGYQVQQLLSPYRNFKN